MPPRKTAETSATMPAPQIQRDQLTITDEFAERLESIAAERNGIEPAATVAMHEMQENNATGPQVRRWTWEQFDEGEVARGRRPGRYFLILRVAGSRQWQAKRSVIVHPEDIDRAAAVETPPPSPPPPPPVAPIGATDIVGVMMGMMQAMNQQAQQAAAQSQATNNLLLGKLLEGSTRSPERSMLQELVELDELLDRRASKRDHDGGELAAAAAPLLSALADGMKQAKAGAPPVAQPTAAPPAKQITATPAKPAPPTEDQRWAALIVHMADTLAAGAKHPDTDPEAYALVLLDYIEAAGFDPRADMLDKAAPDQIAAALCVQYPQLPADFVVSVERAMRVIVQDEADATPADTTPGKDSPDAPTAPDVE